LATRSHVTSSVDAPHHSAVPPTRSRVLIVEDDQDYAWLLGYWLAGAGFDDSDHCSDAESAIASAALVPYAAALVDLGLPDARGLEILERLLRVDPHLPIVVLTGQDDSNATGALRVGAQDYLVKGAGDSEVTRAIRYAVARAETESDLRCRTEELERSNADLAEFSAVLAHDLRSPVKTSRLFLDLLLRRDATDPDYTDLGQRLDESFARLEQIVLGLLSYTAARDEQFGISVVDLNAVVETTVDQLHAVLDENHACVAIGEMPAVHGNAEVIGRVMQNLIENSVKYRRPDVPLEIAICARHVDASSVEVQVTDNGRGIPDQHREQVFELLERLHHREEIDGLGIGLAMCRRMISRLGGHIWVDGDGPPGASVRFTLPVAQIARGDDGDSGMIGCEVPLMK